jgi:hypothetical protein
MPKANQDVEITNSKGELIASIEDGEDDGSINIVFWNPPKVPNKGQGGSTHFVLSKNRLSLTSESGKSKIVFCFSEDEEPKIEAIRNSKVVWSTDQKLKGKKGKS